MFEYICRKEGIWEYICYVLWCSIGVLLRSCLASYESHSDFFFEIVKSVGRQAILFKISREEIIL